MENVILQIDTYDENKNCKVIFFTVTKEWLRNNISISLDDFINTYTSIESDVIYQRAIKERVVIHEEVSI